MSNDQTMWYRDLNHEQFLKYLKSRKTVAKSPQIEVADSDFLCKNEIASGELRLIWKYKPMDGKLPSLIVLRQSEQLEFFAGMDAFLSGWTPISPLIRVITQEKLVWAQKLQGGQCPQSSFQNAILGMVFSEAIGHAAETNMGLAGTQLSLNSCLATCSFAIGCSAGLGCDRAPDIATTWRIARGMVGQPTLFSNTYDILRPWSVLAEIFGFSMKFDETFPFFENRSDFRSIVEICRGLRSNGEVDLSCVANLTQEMPELEEAFENMYGSRELRVRSFEQAVNATLQRCEKLSSAAGFVCGLLASRISPGRLDHIATLVPYLKPAKGIMLSYGLCTGITKNSKIINYSASLGRRVIREMSSEETIYSVPQCDISFDELFYLRDSFEYLKTLLLHGSTNLNIEISPCINTLVRSPIASRIEKLNESDSIERCKNNIEQVLRDVNQSLEDARNRLGEIV